MREFIIKKNDAGQRLDKFVAKAVPLLPPALMHKYLRIKRIKLNEKRAEPAQKLMEGDNLKLYINDEFFEAPTADNAFLRLTPRLDIIYEDEHILLADKPAGMVVHEDESGELSTLINNIKAYLYQSGAWKPQDEQSFVPALCNRIDRNTSGLVIAAKTAEALRVLNQKIKDREIAKYYLCLVHGRLTPPNGRLKSFLTRDLREKKVSVSRKPIPGALTAITDYKTLGTRQNISLLECELLTGRTHQIRAQLADVGHPLAGDTKYGEASLNAGLPFKFQALCSYKLRFDFTTDSGELDYLRGKTFETSNVPFMDFWASLT